MKIIYDHKIFWSQKYGGISRYFVNLFKNLQVNRKVDFKIIAPFYQNKYLVEEVNNEKIFGIYLKNKIPKTSFIYEKFNDFFFKYGAHNFKPNIIHSTYYNESIKKKTIPLIITVYDLIHEKLALKKNKKIFPKLKSLEIADHIIAISKKTKEDLVKFYNVNENKISVTYLGSNHALLDNNEYQSTNQQKPFILYVGSREKYKNFEFFLKGYSLSSKLKNDFNIILFGGGKLSKDEKKFIHELKLDDKVIYKEGNDKELYNLYRSSKAFIFPSLHEGFGLPLIEAMVNECPVICSKNEIFEEIAGDAAEYFDPTNLENFKEKVEKTLYSSSKIDELKLLGKKTSQAYNWEKCSSETLKIYEKFK